MFKIFHLTLFIVLLQFSFGQVIGSRSNSDLSPSKVEPNQLSGGGYSGDVNVFNGSYNSSYPLGTVTTPGGISYGVQLNYSPSYSAGESPSICSGIPYGEGWHINTPMITVSNAAYFPFLKQYECIVRDLNQPYTDPLEHNYFDSNDTTNGHTYRSGQVQGDLFWFSPKISLPSVGSGRAVFKYIDENDANCAVFVMNKFERHCEIRFYGDRWIIIDDSGNSYFFNTTLVTYRSPNNQRTLNYNPNSKDDENQMSFIINEGEYGPFKEEVLNVTEPKKAFTSWYCDVIKNKNIPNQLIDFDYEKFGAFNYFQEFKQPLVEDQMNDKLRDFPIGYSAISQDYTAYTDILLTKVTSKVELTPYEVLDLDYKLIESSKMPGHILDPRDQDVERLDSLYSYTTVYSQGDNTDFQEWYRYYHGKSDGASNITGTNPTISNLNPYLSGNTSIQGSGYIREQLLDQDKLTFSHGFLESPRILRDNTTLVPGDIYEVKTQIADNNGASQKMGNGTVDINIATGDLNVHLPDTFCVDYDTQNQVCNQYQHFGLNADSYSQLNQPDSGVIISEDYNDTRGGTVFTTFNQAIKWQIPTTAQSINTSNFFVMPNVPTLNDGMNIQIGPGNSDTEYGTPEQFSQNGVENSGPDDPSAYKAYAHMNPGSNPNSEIGSYETIPHNFGIGMPWSMVEPIYSSLMGATSNTYPKDQESYEFWYNDDPQGNISWANEPTKFDDQVYLKKVELVRYSKSPYMLKSAKLYRVNGELSIHDDTSALILVSEQEMSYEVESDLVIENLNYRLGESDTLQAAFGRQHHVYTLNEIKNIPVAGWQDDPTVSDNYTQNEILQTEFEYDWFGLDVLDNIDYDIYQNPGRRTRVMTKVIDQLGGETLIEYYDFTHPATLKETSYRPMVGCTSYNNEPPVIPPSGAKDIHPTVHYVTKLDENNNLTNSNAQVPLKRIEYVYSTNQKVYQSTDFVLPNKFRDGYKKSYNTGFAETTVYNPELESGEKTYTVYEHIGNIVPLSAGQDNPTIEEYLFFGKPSRIASFNSNDEIEEETLFEYDFTLAYLNGYERPNFERENLISTTDFTTQTNWVHAREYEYADYYKNEQPSYLGKIVGYDLVANDGNPTNGYTYVLSNGYTVSDGEVVAHYNYTGGWEVYVDNYEEIPANFLSEVTVYGDIVGEDAKPVILEGTYLGPKWGSPVEKSQFLETYFYNDLKSISANPEFYFHSYFCKTVKKKNRIYDLGCSKNALVVEEVIPYPPGIAEDPFGQPYDNPVIHNTAQEEIKLLIANSTGDGTNILDDLKNASPLSETNLLALINKSRLFKSSVIKNVLVEQPALSDNVLLAAFDKSARLNQGHMVAIIDAQPYLSDPFLKSLSGGKQKYPKQLMRKAYLFNPYLSDRVMIHIISDNKFPQDLLKQILLEQPQLSKEVLFTITNPELKVDGFVISKVMVNQPVLTSDIFEAVLSNPNLTAKDIVKVFTESSSYPAQDYVLLDVLGDKRLSIDDKVAILLAANRTFTEDLLNKITITIPREESRLIELAQLDANPYGKFCNNTIKEDRLYIETVTEYSYYEANNDGSTLAEGFKKLMGLEDVPGKTVTHPDLNNGNSVQLDEILLKHQPSWQLFKTKTYSPNYPGAFNEEEYYYYYDLLNRYSRHFEYYDLENGNYISENDPTLSTNDLVFNSYWPNDHQLTGSYAGHIPLADGAKNSQRNQVRNIAFQKTNFSKNNYDEEAVMRSEYYYYHSRWNENIPYIQASVDYDGPSCPSGSNDNGCTIAYECDGCYPVKYAGDIQELMDDLPFGYCLYYVGEKDSYYACPADVNPSDYGASNVINSGCYPDDINVDPNAGGTKAIYQGNALDNTFQLSQVIVQIDTIPSELYDWTGERTDQSNSYIMDFKLGEENDWDSEGRRMSYGIYPFDTLTVRYIDERNKYNQVSLEHNAEDIYTKYYYHIPERIWHVNTNNTNCPGFGNYHSIVQSNIGLPERITVGYGRNDSLSTSYEYYPNYALSTIINPTGYKLHYEYDDYDRLKNTYENDRLLSSNNYEYWKRNQNLDFLQRTNQNYVETYLYNGPIISGQYEGEHIRAFVDPLGRNYSTTTNIDNDATQVHSGTTEYDNWSRVTKSHKPYKLSNQTQVVRTQNLAQPYTENSYENDNKSRMLRNAKYGINDINSQHTVKQSYKIINKVILGCELSLNAYEIHLLVNPDFTGKVLFNRVEIEDEDGKRKIEYFNAIGQKVATKQYGEDTNDPIITLYTYDSYGNLSRVINPEKQESTYDYNILGQLYRETTVDGGEHKFMYNKLGLVSVELDEQAKEGELENSGDIEKTMFFRTYTYDDYGRLLSQDKQFWKQPYYSGVTNNPGINPLFYKDTVNGLDIDGNPIVNYTLGSTQEYFEYYFSNNSTYDWMATMSYVFYDGNPAHSPIAQNELSVLNFLGTKVPEKSYYYGLSTTANTLGKVEGTFSYDSNGEPIQSCEYTYDDQERMSTEVIKFNADGINSGTENLTARIDYEAYNYRGSLLTMNVDINNDNYLDFQYHYVYDDWNRLRDVYANYTDQQENGNLVAHYDYDDALGLLTVTKHYYNDHQSCGEHQVQEITHNYDVRDRLTAISSELFDYALYYDNDTPPADVNGTMVNHHKNWNGNINGTINTYLFDQASITNSNFAGTMAESTIYGYKYDQINRLFQADAIAGDLVNTNNSLTYEIGDVQYNFDKIGNFTHLDRITGTDINTNNIPILVNQEWEYIYESGTNRLAKVQGQGTTADRNYTYDANGNLLSDDHRDLSGITYTRAAYPEHITKSDMDIEYLYNSADLRMYKKTTTTADTKEEYYLKASSGQDLGIFNMTSINWTWYINGADRIAKVTPSFEQQPSVISETGFIGVDSLDIQFYLYDHLGNTRVVYEPGLRGVEPCVVEYKIHYAADYYPYGKILREYALGEQEKFLTTQHERDLETGLDYRGARFYDSDVARFLSLDPLAADYPSLSDYSYVAGNPIRYIDQNGKDISDPPAWAKILMAIYNPSYGAFESSSITLGGDNTWAGKFIGRFSEYTTGEAAAKSIESTIEYYKENPEMFIMDIYTAGAASATNNSKALVEGVLSGDPEITADAVMLVLAWKSGQQKNSKSNSSKGNGSQKTLYDEAVSKGANVDSKTFYHKGKLNNGKVGKSGKDFSTGTDKLNVSALNRSGKVHEFKIPKKVFDNWMDEGLVKKYKDLDHSTGTYNIEYRFDASIADQLNQYIVK